MSAREVVVTGIGLCSTLGGNLEAFAQALFGHGASFGLLPTRHAGPIIAARVAEDPAHGATRSERNLGDRSTLMALTASTRALHDAGWQARDPAMQACGVYVGCGSGPTHALDEAYAAAHENRLLPGLTLLRCLPSGAAGAVAIRHGLRGPNHTHASACASSAIAIGEAVRAIRHGYLDLALVGGTEGPLGDATVRAWDRLRVLATIDGDPGRACRPFDRHRNGLVLAEGAAFFVLESAAGAAARGARVHARLLGCASSGDGHHWTEPSPDGQVQAMRAALADARLTAADIHGINAHGTATVVGDSVEAASIAAVFGTGTDAPWVYSSKSLHGHTLGASGAIELAACIVSLKQGQLPATRNLDEPDKSLPVRLVSGAPQAMPAGARLLSNSFAFGGSNACLIVTGAG